MYFNTFAGLCNVMTTSVTILLFFSQIVSNVKRSYDKKILHLWSFHINLIKLSKGSYEGLNGVPLRVHSKMEGLSYPLQKTQEFGWLLSLSGTRTSLSLS